MSRKDCKLIADAIARSTFTNKNKVYIGACIADAIKGINPRFNRMKFINACLQSQSVIDCVTN